jgi:selenocysteine lyase/cysteine desulfurase
MTQEEISRYRAETRGCSQVIHLNNAGSGLMPDTVTQTLHDHLQLEANIGGYEAAALKADAIARFYGAAGRLLNCSPGNIAFGSSATDAYTRALSSIPFQAGDVILTDNDDFISNQIQFLSCQRRFGIRIERVRNAPAGGIDLADLEEKLYKFRPRLLAITHIPTNSGLVQPVEEIATIYDRYIRSHEGDSWYILDACQSAGQMKLDVQALRCDFLSVTARKFLRGPRGTGFLYVSDRALQQGLEPLFLDMRGAEWIQKDEYRQNPTAMRFEDWEFAYALVLGTAEAIDYCLAVGEDAIRQRVRFLADTMRRKLSELPGIRVLDRGPQLGGLVTFHVNGGDPITIVKGLLHRRINVVPSYRRFAVIDFDEKGVEWAVRASPHYYNTEEEVDALIAGLKEITPA